MSKNDMQEIVDYMINLDMTGRGVIHRLYEAARSEAGQPLTQLAATRISQALEKPETQVLILYGFLSQSRKSQ